MNWQAVTDAFEKARTLPASERTDFLRRYCGGDEELLREAASLLEAYDSSGDFLADPAVPQGAAEWLGEPSGGRIGERLGAYRITRRIGAGGMGEVYEAERADGEFRQRVAIKIVREDWPDRRRHDRFRAERQILSDLNHPYIARLLDGGATGDGAPYLVMELIEGEPIDRYAQARGLGLAQRLAMFAKICGAVEYANQRHVIHCDIKPGNILVTGEGIPKLLDFGISRLMAEGREATATLGRAATPEYASPEQLDGREITAASDVYSLGAVLRQLISGLPAPASVARVVARATAAEPSRRYGSAGALEDAVQRAASPVWSRRRAIGALAGGGAAAAAGVFGWRTLRRPVLERGDALAVMRIENRTGEAGLDWIDRGLADLLATNLAQAEGFEVISTARCRELLARAGNNQRQAAEAGRAGYYITGDLLRVGSRLRLNLRVERTADGHIQAAQRFEGESAQAIVALADQASSAILGELRAVRPDVASASRVLSANVEALRLYEEGCDYLERFRIPPARESLRRAIEIDPQFAMAYYRLGLCDPWNPPSALRDFERAAELAGRLRLPGRERQLMDASRLMAAGRLPEAAGVLRALARRNARDVEARVLLTEALVMQWDFPAASRAAEEAVAIDPYSREAELFASMATGLAGRFADAHAYADRYIASLKPGDWNGLDLRGDLFCQAERFGEAVETYTRVKRMSKVALASMHKGDLDRAGQVLKEIVSRSGPPVSMGGCLSFLGDVEVGRGRLEAARSWFEQGVRAYADFAWYGGLVLWKAAQLYLEQGRPETALGVADGLAGHSWSPGVRAVALLAMGKTADAEASLTAMRASIGALLGGFMAARYEELYRLLGAFYAGSHEQAAAMADRVPNNLWHLFALAAGRANLALGRLEAADRHLQFARRMQLCWGAPGLYEAHNFLAFLLGEFYLGQVAARRGRKDEALQKFEFFLRHFRNSPDRLPQIAEARSALRG